MIINCHAHIYPDKIAKPVEEGISKRFGPLYSSFKVSSLLEDMDKFGIEKTIGFCIGERPKAVEASNNFVISLLNNEKIIPFGTLLPDLEGYKEEIQKLKQNGIKGIKLSSIFQNLYPDEERMMRIYQELGDDFIVYFHAGEDIGRPPEEAHTTPQRLARVLALFPRLKVAAAHFGGLNMLQEVKKHLLGKELYFDTVWTPGFAGLDKKEMALFIQRHGSHKVLFGTDFPIYDTKEQLEWVSSLPLSPEDLDLIFYKNAQRLLGL
jgi:predicted TIM-barrel fold metal-dependent hydrolase